MEDRDTKALLPSHSANGYAESIPRRSGATTRRRGYSVEYFAEEYRGDSEGYRGNYSAEEYSSECSAEEFLKGCVCLSIVCSFAASCLLERAILDMS